MPSSPATSAWCPKRTELTTEGGLEVAGALAAVTDAVGLLAESGIRVSLFIDPELAQIAAAAQAGAPVVELHTGAYAEAQDEATARAELTRIRVAVAEACATDCARMRATACTTAMWVRWRRWTGSPN